MKIVTKEVKDKTIADLDSAIQKIEKQLQEECSKCDGTGLPKTKTGNPPVNGMKNTKCKDCGGTGILGSSINVLKNDMDKIRKEVKRISDKLSAHINKQSAEIRVWVVDKETGVGEWEDYTGTFNVNNDEEKSIAIGKARYHFETYFKDGAYHLSLIHI